MAAPWPHQIPDAERDKIVRLYRDHGVLISDIARRLHRGTTTVIAVLKKAGVEPNPRRRRWQECV